MKTSFLSLCLISMNATKLYVSVCRAIFLWDPKVPATFYELRRLLPVLRQSISCSACGQILNDPLTPVDTTCQHHICRRCRGQRKKRLKPPCGWCTEENKHVENGLLTILIKCYSKLCQVLLAGNCAVREIVDLLQEGASLADRGTAEDILLNSTHTTKLTRSLQKICSPCELSSLHDKSNARPVRDPSADEMLEPVSNCDGKPVVKRKQDPQYSVQPVDSSGTKITIRRKLSTAVKVKQDDQCGEEQSVTKKKPLCHLSLKQANVKTSTQRQFGCRCGNATIAPGKLTCGGQRCPCYVGLKACVNCACRGCRNPHHSEGKRRVTTLLPCRVSPYIKFVSRMKT